jgi:hypothetical protein
LQQVLGIVTEEAVETMSVGELFRLELQQHAPVILALVENAHQELHIERSIERLNEVSHVFIAHLWLLYCW